MTRSAICESTGGWLQREDLEGAQHDFELSAEAGRALLGGAIPKLGRDDDTRVYPLFANIAHTLRDPAPGVADEVRHDVRVE
jgi:hypothetical protein